jgi:isoamylase
MLLNIRLDGSDIHIQLDGDLVGPLDDATRSRLVELVRPGRKLIVDLTQWHTCSGMSLRRLLLMFRWVRSQQCEIELRGVPDEFRSCAEAAGFTDLFRSPVNEQHTPPPSHSPTPRIDIFPTHFHQGLGIRPGTPYPMGATRVARGVNFSVYSKHATAIHLVLFHLGESEPFAEIPFPEEFRIGHVFTMVVFDLDPEEVEYGYRVYGPFEPEKGHRFNDQLVLLDPYARCIAGFDGWGNPRMYQDSRYPYRTRILPEDYDWQGDRQLQLPTEDLIIYEMHVRGFTQSPTSKVRYPGTFAAIREKIPYLKELGINCIELMPIFEFDETDNPRHNPLTGERLWNYWGYNTITFQAPKASYAASNAAQLQSEELKSTVKELHRHGIEIILDVVFNHTAEGNESGPTISLRGLDNETYYMLTPTGEYFNFSGCGNTLNCNHPVVREFVLHCLRHWVAEYHIDGFRFDLASILGRDDLGHPLSNPPLLEALAMDPVLGKTKLIAEAWDAGGLYQVGSFPSYGRWAEWNGKYRDTIRKFLKGDSNMVSEMATRLVGSPDLYATRGPAASINFITCHDGFTLHDLVSYNEKHNEANGEENRDGANDNHSWNCGAEGETDDPVILALRQRQMRNAITLLMLSQGVPMLLMGDEVCRTQQGNNNTYCHDSPLNWLDWSLLETNQDFFRFCKNWFHFRREHPVLRHPAHVGREHAHRSPLEVSWHGHQPWNSDWSGESRFLAFMIRQRLPHFNDSLYAAFNMHWEPAHIELPEPIDGDQWYIFVDTSQTSPHDIAEVGQENQVIPNRKITLAPRSCLVAVAKE